MSGFKVSISGLQELDKALGELPKATARNVLKRTLIKAGEPIAERARQLVPVNTGHLRDSIIVSSRIKNKVGSSEYSSAMRAGLGKRAAVAALRTARREAKGQGSFAETFIGPSRGKGVIAYAHLIEFGKFNAPAQPYMRPAWDSEKQRALDIIKSDLSDEIIKAARRVGRSKKQSYEVKYRASIAAMIAAGF
jgi:HK97 gp10 family phage protein